MFFSISREFSDNFPSHWQVGEFCISTDNGWESRSVGDKTVIFKGYSDNAPMGSIIDQIINEPTPSITGNFCAIAVSGNTLRIHHDRYRSFPIYVTEKSINNLLPIGKSIWANSLIRVDSNLSVTESKFNIIGEISTDQLSYNQVVSEIVDTLDRRVSSFLAHNTRPIKVFLSGGVDSLLVYSVLKKHTSNYELIKCSHIDYDLFWLKNSADIQQHWGYRQIHHWTEPCILTSGAPGDEFMLRNPVIAAKFLRAHGLRIQDLLQQEPWASSMHSKFFARPEYQRAFQELKSQPRLPLLILALCNEVVNDWQHWHIGNTLTWTPLRDLEIFKLMLRLPAQDALGQIFNSQLSKDIIEINDPGLTQLLSEQKNTGNAMANLANLLLAHR